jgi:hypothetical protein
VARAVPVNVLPVTAGALQRGIPGLSLPTVKRVRDIL